MDATFYIVAALCVILVGFGKGGMGDALGLMGVPILSFVMPPVQAAAILLPILIVMDAAALWSWRRDVDMRLLKHMLPGGLAGIALGWATWSIVPDYAMRLVIGIVAVSFAGRFFVNRYLAGSSPQPARSPSFARASFWSTLSGYGSFVAHAGGAPFQVYGLPLRLPPRAYTGAAVRFFAILNAIKLVPYFALGAFDTKNLYLSAILLPLAPAATFAGAWVVKRMRPDVFYPWMYGMLVLAGLKLAWDGIKPLAALVF